jgi:hypothetical protein
MPILEKIEGPLPRGWLVVIRNPQANAMSFTLSTANIKGREALLKFCWIF